MYDCMCVPVKIDLWICELKFNEKIMAGVSSSSTFLCAVSFQDDGDSGSPQLAGLCSSK